MDAVFITELLHDSDLILLASCRLGLLDHAAHVSPHQIDSRSSNPQEGLAHVGKFRAAGLSQLRSFKPTAQQMQTLERWNEWDLRLYSYARNKLEAAVRDFVAQHRRCNQELNATEGRKLWRPDASDSDDAATTCERLVEDPPWAQRAKLAVPLSRMYSHSRHSRERMCRGRRSGDRAK
uniref:Uncharacterized protein n=2 Tax=Rhizochromulina marina TaxID=1034831 RepID=A0A7S2WST6_9STRA|mmetsp:Transcript_32155/g.93352  ORF Transcript_32155/g.93352 Transcript_32155/m.93352 type:complete len:179 (+) Transcript_32155:499-1035(+)